MRGLINLLGFVALIGLMGFSALVAHEADWTQIQATFYNATMAAWETAWQGGIDVIPWVPVFGWLIGIIVGFLILAGLASLLGGIARRAFERVKTEKKAAEPIINQKILEFIAKITGTRVINEQTALTAISKYSAESRAVMEDLEVLDGPRFAPCAGLLFGNPYVMRKVKDFVAEVRTGKPMHLGAWARTVAATKLLWNGEPLLKAAVPRKRVAKPKANPAPATAAPTTPVVAAEPATPAPAEAANPATLSAEPAPPAQAEVAQPAAGPTAAAAARVDITIRSGTGQADDTVVVEEVAVTPTPAAEPPIPPAEAPMGDRKGKRGGGRKPFDQRYKGFSG